MKELRSVVGKVGVQNREDGAPVIEGYSAVFGVKETIDGLFTESINSGAFNRVLQEKQDTKALFDHRSDYILGRVGNGTLVLRADNIGLFMTNTPNMNVSYAKDLVENIKRNDIHGQSFAFTVRKSQWTFSSDESGELDHREIMEIGDLYDVGPVTYPAYSATSVSARSSAEQLHKRAVEFVKEFRSANSQRLSSLILDANQKVGTFQSVECRSGFFEITVGPDALEDLRVPLIRKSTPTSILHKILDTSL